MNYLANALQKVTTIDSTNLLNGTSIKQQLLLQEALLKNVVQLISDEKERHQFLQQLQAIGLMSYQQQHITIDSFLPLESTTLLVNEADSVWLAEVEQQVSVSMIEFEFTLERLSQLIFLSPRQIRRRLKRLTGKTFSQYLKEARLKKAYELLINREIRSIKTLAYRVGLRDVKYFSKQFKAYYGESPSTYLV